MPLVARVVYNCTGVINTNLREIFISLLQGLL